MSRHHSRKTPWTAHCNSTAPAGTNAPRCETEQRLSHTETHEWNHGLGEVVTALLAHGLQLTALVEHQSIPWEALPGQMLKGSDGEYRLREQPARLPLSYTLVAVKA